MSGLYVGAFINMNESYHWIGLKSLPLLPDDSIVWQSNTLLMVLPRDAISREKGSFSINYSFIMLILYIL
jgi:hypothetical protein